MQQMTQKNATVVRKGRGNQWTESIKIIQDDFRLRKKTWKDGI